MYYPNRRNLHNFSSDEEQTPLISITTVLLSDLQILGTLPYKMLLSSDAQTICAIQRIKGSQVDPKSDLVIYDS
jgi:hypothetical protein